MGNGQTLTRTTETGLTRDDGPAPELADRYRTMLKTMLLARHADERLVRLYRQGAIKGGVYLGIGQEAIGAATTAASEPPDLFAPLIRNMSVFVGRGVTMPDIFRQWLGRAGSPTRGRDGNVHYGSHAHGIYAMISHLGAMVPVVIGGVMARRRQGQACIGFAYVGDGATSTGDFHEAANFAAVFDVPVILVIENNHYAYSTPTEAQYRCERLIDRAKGYGMEGYSADGNDAIALYRLVKGLADDIRRSPRPVMIECETMRMRGHGEHDDFSYVPPSLLDKYRKHDPIEVARQQLVDAGLLSNAVFEALSAGCLETVDQAYRQALAEPEPDPATLMDGVYAAD